MSESRVKCSMNVCQHFKTDIVLEGRLIFPRKFWPVSRCRLKRRSTLFRFILIVFLFLHVCYYRFSLFTVIKRDPDVKSVECYVRKAREAVTTSLSVISPGQEKELWSSIQSESVIEGEERGNGQTQALRYKHWAD